MSEIEKLPPLDSEMLKKLRPIEAMRKVGIHMLLNEFQFVKKEFRRMDLFGFNHGGDCCELELKVSGSDVLKELKNKPKLAKHTRYKNGIGFIPTRYYFLINETARIPTFSMIEKHSLPYGVIVYNSSSGKYWIETKSQRMTEEPFICEEMLDESA